jgi:outer membrane protein
MNTIKKVLLVAVITFGFGMVQAQTKVAHIDSDELVAAMPETKALQAKLEVLGKSYNDEAAKKSAELEAKFKKYNEEFETQTDLVNAERTKEVQADAQKIESF